MVGGLESFELSQAEFTGEDGLVDAEGLCKIKTFGRGDGHLCAGMKPQARGEAFDHAGQAEVLDDDGVDARRFERAELAFGIGEDTRIVLGDWYTQESRLRDENGRLELSAAPAG